MASRAGLLARLRRLERPSGSRAALERELEELQRRYASPTLSEIHHMTDEQLDDYFRMESAEDGPWQRVAEIKELLRTPAERAELERESTRLSALSMDELEAELRALLNREAT